ncbi:uncharacterized protein NEMAJ01_1123 [Nematocida major]|uniref:uncharacterized protein n=1 Tax=Nematocida major TaxID=1912982 RepID=UPI002007B572|nr:uncharacterized protein NEMAJ01_1123 [Nematocida major]KAH9386227.1 hypothetical protein NEMAJ01_1123 [Nematocida major]
MLCIPEVLDSFENINLDSFNLAIENIQDKELFRTGEEKMTRKNNILKFLYATASGSNFGKLAENINRRAHNKSSFHSKMFYEAYSALSLFIDTACPTTEENDCPQQPALHKKPSTQNAMQPQNCRC